MNTKDPVGRVWFVTGASAGFGRAIVKAALDAGDRVRTNPGRAVEETTDAELRNLFELHFFAPVALAQAVLPIMSPRRRRRKASLLAAARNG